MRCLGRQHGQRRHFVVALDQRRPRAQPFERALVERPHGGIDGRAVVVDQQAITRGIAVLGEAGEVDLADRVNRQRLDQRPGSRPWFTPLT